MKTFKMIGAVLLTAMLCANFSACSSDPIIPEVTVEMGNEDYFVKNMDFDSSAGEKSFAFNSNVEWTVSVAPTMNGETWCTVTPSSGAKGDNAIRVKVKENTGYDDRNVVLTLTAGSTLTKTITVTQKQKDAILLTSNKFEIEPQGGKINIEVKSNVNYEAIISESCKDWISLSSKSRGLTASNITFDVAATEEYDKREGEITIKSGNLSEVVRIYQTGQGILLLTQNEYPVTDKGETITVEIKSNFSFDVQMPEVEWIVDEAQSKGVSSHTLYYKVLPNETYDSREAEIVFYDKNDSTKDTLKVIQAQKDAIVISQKTYEVKGEGETVEVKLSANVDFEVTMSEVDWISQVESRALTEHTLYFKVAENAGEESRSTKIVFTNKDSQLSDEVVINQGFLPKGSYIDGVVTINTAGTLKKFLGDDYLNITTLKIVGPINGDDIRNLRQMLGGSEFNDVDKGKLTTLDLSKASIVKGGDAYYSSYTTNDAIGSYMFYECVNLQNMTLPFDVTSIDNEAFKNCSSLISINIPDGVTSIGKSAFYGCSSLTSIDIPDGITSINSFTFYECSSLTSIDIPDDVISIRERAFLGCSSLTSIDIPNSVTLILERAFAGCSSLTSINIPDGVTSIRDGVFVNCSSLTTINIPASVASIGDSSFYNCSRLTSVIITDLSAWCNITFDDNSSNPLQYGATLYLNNQELTKLVIPEEITEIKAHAFRGYSSLSSVTMGTNVTSIGESAFYGCSSLASIDISDGITEIGKSAFYDCSSLTSIDIPDGVTEIGQSTFLGCSSLTTINIPANVTKIGISAFYDCSSLTTINIPDGVAEIKSATFCGCSSLTTINIPASVANISDRAFLSCNSLKSVHITDLSAWCNITFDDNYSNPLNGDAKFYLYNNELTELVIPADIKRIKDYAFYGCNSLTKVTMSEGVTSVGIQSFRDCSALTQVYCQGTTPPTINTSSTNSSFNGASDSRTLYVLTGCIEIYQNSDWANYFEEIIEME